MPSWRLLGPPLGSAVPHFAHPLVPFSPSPCCCAAGLLTGNTQVLVNSQLEANPGHPLATGDVVDLYAEPAVPAVALPPLAPPVPLRAAHAPVGSSAVVKVSGRPGRGKPVASWDVAVGLLAMWQPASHAALLTNSLLCGFKLC